MDLLAAVERESRRFLEVLEQAEGAGPVPTCPDWSVDDLLWHLAEVQLFWGAVVARRLQEPEEAKVDPAARPGDRAGLLGLARRASSDLVASLGAVDDDEPVWTWSEDRTAGFVLRRQAHEALVHRVDAEIAAGADRAPVDPALAADGVDEALRVMYGGVPGWATSTWDAGGVEVHARDVDRSWQVVTGRFRGTSPRSGRRYDEPVLDVIGGSSSWEPQAVLRGRAEDLDLWLWGRAPLAGLHLEGDSGAVDRLAAVVAAGVQ